ncbi:hypothetical protein D3C87_419870 [compost metagenome]
MKISAIIFLLLQGFYLTHVSAQDKIYTGRKGLKFFSGHIEIVVSVSADTLHYDLFDHWYSKSYSQLRDEKIALTDLTIFNLDSQGITITLKGNKVIVRDRQYKINQRLKDKNLCVPVQEMRKIFYAYRVAKLNSLNNYDLYQNSDLKLSEDDFYRKVDLNLKLLLADKHH